MDEVMLLKTGQTSQTPQNLSPTWCIDMCALSLWELIGTHFLYTVAIEILTSQNQNGLCLVASAQGFLERKTANMAIDPVSNWVVQIILKGMFHTDALNQNIINIIQYPCPMPWLELRWGWTYGLKKIYLRGKVARYSVAALAARSPMLSSERTSLDAFHFSLANFQNRSCSNRRSSIVSIRSSRAQSQWRNEKGVLRHHMRL